MQPLIRYVGGKRWLAPAILPAIRAKLSLEARSHYIEPFFGGGAVGLELGWRNTIANDQSVHLIGAYTSITTAPEAVAFQLQARIRELFDHENPAAHYHTVRSQYNARTAWDPSRAADFLYIQTCCFNGILRTNRDNKLNVPIGKTRRKFPTTADLLAFAETTKTWGWRCGDFASAVNDARRGDVIFADPPYADTFGGYTKKAFTDDDQVLLADMLEAARGRGVYVITTNSENAMLLYLKRDFHVVTTHESRTVNSDKAKRKPVRCMIAVSHPELYTPEPAR